MNQRINLTYDPSLYKGDLSKTYNGKKDAAAAKDELYCAGFITIKNNNRFKKPA